MSRITFGFRASLGFGVCVIAAAAYANLIQNGDFEQGNFVPNGQNTMSLFPGWSELSNWAISTAEIAWISDPNPFGFSASSGIRSLDLMGYHDSQPSGQIFQAFATSPGIAYRVRFDVGKYSEIVVHAAGQSTTVVGPPVNENQWWITRQWVFVANSTQTTLTFLGGPNTYFIYAGLDNVRVDADFAQLELHVDLNDFEGTIAGTPVVIEVRAVGSTIPLETQTINLNSIGDCIYASGLPSGNYDIAVKAPHWLRRVMPSITFTVGSTTSASVSLTNGDVDGDNEVNLVDYGLGAAAFGSIDGDPNWNPLADLNGDEEVNLVDIAIVSANFGQAGDE